MTAEFQEKVPAHSLEMEMAVLGSILLDSMAFKEASALLRAESFYRPSHRAIFRAAADVAKQGRPTTLEFVTQRLRDTDQLQGVGGEDFIMQIAEYVPSPSNARYYAGIVAEKAELRAYDESARKLTNAILDGTDIDEIRLMAASIGQSQHRSPAFRDISDIDASGDDVGVSTGIEGIDQAIATKGFPVGQMSVVSAYHKAGKSSFMVQSFVHQSSQGLRCLYGTFADLNAKRLKRRMLRVMSGWSRLPERADLFDVQEFERALKEIDAVWDGQIFDASESDLEHIETFISQLEVFHRERKFDVVYLDYAQQLSSSNKRAQFGGLAEQAWISKFISRTAQRLDIAIVVGSQITEGGKEGRTITKGGRCWEEDAGLVLRIKREGQNSMEVEIPYSRFGGCGTVVTGYWDTKRLSFVEAVR